MRKILYILLAILWVVPAKAQLLPEMPLLVGTGAASVATIDIYDTLFKFGTTNTNTINTSDRLKTTNATGNFFVVCIAEYWFSGTPTQSMTDNYGNTYTATVSRFVTGSQPRITYWTCANAIGGAGHFWTYTTTGTNSIPLIFVFCLNAPSATVAQSSGSTVSGASNTVNTGNITTTTANNFITAAAASLGGTGTPTINNVNGWDNSQQYSWTNFVSGQRLQFVIYGRFQVAAGAAGGATHTFGAGSINPVSVILSVKPF